MTLRSGCHARLTADEFPATPGQWDNSVMMRQFAALLPVVVLLALPGRPRRRRGGWIVCHAGNESRRHHGAVV